MDKDIGKKIKKLTEDIVFLLTIPSVILGIAAMVLLSDTNFPLGIVVGIIIMVIGYFIAWLAKILLYGYGELIDKTSSIEALLAALLLKNQDGTVAKAVPAEGENADLAQQETDPTVSKNQDES